MPKNRRKNKQGRRPERNEKLFANAAEEPKEQRKDEAENETGDNGEVEGSVFAAMDDVAWETAKAEGQLGAEVEECADKHEEHAQD
jgi:hypothetical protein